MALKLDRPHLAITFALAVASALAFYFGTGLHPIWWLTWFARFPFSARPALAASASLRRLPTRFVRRLAESLALFPSRSGSPLAILISLFCPRLFSPSLSCCSVGSSAAVRLCRLRWRFRHSGFCSEFLNAATSVHSTAAATSPIRR